MYNAKDGDNDEKGFLFGDGAGTMIIASTQVNAVDSIGIHEPGCDDEWVIDSIEDWVVDTIEVDTVEMDSTAVDSVSYGDIELRMHLCSSREGNLPSSLPRAAIGYEAIPQFYKDDLELHDLILHMADDLYLGEVTKMNKSR